MMIPAEPRTLPPGWVERFDADGNVWYDIQEEQDDESSEPSSPPTPQPNTMSFAQKLYASSLPAPGPVRRSQSYQVTSVPPSVPERHMQPRRATTSSTPTVSLVARAPSSQSPSSQNPPSPPIRYANPPPAHPSRQPSNRNAPMHSPPVPTRPAYAPPVPTRSAYSPPVPSYSSPAPPSFPSQYQSQNPPTRDRGMLSDAGGAVLKVAGGALLSALTGGLLSSESVDGLVSVFSAFSGGGDAAPSALGFDYSGLQAVAQGLPGAQYQSLVDILMQQQQQPVAPGVDYQSIVNELLNIQQNAAQNQAQAPSYQPPAPYQPPASYQLPASYQPPAAYQPPAPYQPPANFMAAFHQQHQQIMEQNLQNLQNVYGGHQAAPAPTANLYEQIRYNQQQATMQMMQSMMDAQRQGVGVQQAQTQAILNAVYGGQPPFNPYHGAR